MERSKSKPQVMVVDDDPDTLTILARFLEREGFVAVRAASGLECLRLVEEVEIDVILLDLMMPEMDGFEVCRVLKSREGTAAIPIIMITARDDLEARAEGMRLGVSDFLAKPVFRRQLATRIRAQLEVVQSSRHTAAMLDRISPYDGKN